MNKIQDDDPCGPGKFVAPVRSIALRTEIPGPKSRAALERRAAAMGTALAPRIVVGQAHGARVIDVDNNVFIDFASGTDGLGMGHTHEQIVSAVQRAAETVDLLPLDAATETETRLAMLLSTLIPHGEKTKARLYNQPEQALTALRGAGEITLIEPVTLAGEVITVNHDRGWLVSDERHLNIGRLGTYGAAQAVGLQPDVTLVNLRSGAELYALVGRAAILDQMPERTEAVHPLACAAALAGLTLVQEQQLVARVGQLAALLREQTAWQASRSAGLADMRNVGALFVLKMETAARAHQLVENALQRGLLLRTAASDPACVPLLYALMIPEEQFYEGLDVIEQCLG